MTGRGAKLRAVTADRSVTVDLTTVVLREG